MKLQFKNQKFQTDAAKAVTDVFCGQRNAAMADFTLDAGSAAGSTLFEEVGYRNSKIELSQSQILDNIRKAQMSYMLLTFASFCTKKS